MSDKLESLYEAYDIEVGQTFRGRGAVILKTNCGIRQLKLLDVNESRLEAEYKFKEKLYELGFTGIDRCVPNKDEELVTCDRYNNPYVMRTYFEGRECSLTNPSDIRLAVENLGRFHIAGRQLFMETEGDVHVRRDTNFRRRNQELRRIRTYILRRSPRKEFEQKYLEAFDKFFGQAEACERNEKNFPAVDNSENQHIGYCHGMYNQHSIIMSGDGRISTTGFDKFHVGNQLGDLYHFLRKAVEKNNYSVNVLKEIFEEYNCMCPLKKADYEYIYSLFVYPEKFYKIGNQYMNSPKNWISPKMLEKLNKVIADDDKKNVLLNQLKSLYLLHI